MAGSGHLLPHDLQHRGIPLHRLRSLNMDHSHPHCVDRTPNLPEHTAAAANLLLPGRRRVARRRPGVAAGPGSCGRQQPRSGTESRDRVYDLQPRQPHFEPKATSVIQFFMNGGPSQVDLFDPKPALERYAGKPPGRDLASTIEFINEAGGFMPSPFKFKRYGQVRCPTVQHDAAPGRAGG